MSQAQGRFAKLWKELKRRHVVQVATVYAMAAWLVIQFAVAVFPYLDLPKWSVTAVILLAFVGFPIALIVSWIYDLGPKGLVVTADADEAIEGPEQTNGKRGSMGSVVIIVLAVLLVGQYFYFKHWKAEAAPLMAEAASSRSLAVAVLPFVNRSSDVDQEFFSDGLTEDIITQLAKIKDLHVISRTTCMKYKGDTLSIKEIGTQLNVGTILEGSVQRAGDQLRITAQLIDVATDAHLWAESYDRSISDLFSIQREIATAIAGMLQKTLTPDEVNSLAAIPTKSIEAYQAYLKGRYLSHKDHFVGETALQAIVHLEQAVQLDSTFALAYAELARCHARVYYLRTDQTEERRTMATRAAEKALALAPDEPGVHLAIGDYLNWGFRDKAKAMEHWSIAEKGLPNNAELITARAMFMFAEGQVDAATAELEKAVALSPKDAGGFMELAWVRMWAHDFPGSIAAADKAIELAPDENWPYLYRGISYFVWKGPCPEAYAALDAVDHDYPWYVWAMYNMEVADGRIDAALARVATLPDGWSMLKTEVTPAVLYEAFLRQHLGETDVARAKYKEAVALLEKELPAHPEDARYHSALGLALAGAGQKERAVEMGRKATELLPYSKDMGYGVNAIYDLAVIHALVGNFDKAFEQLEFNLSNPGNFTVPWMEGDVRFDVLRKDPRYAALLKKYALPKEPV
ncbi:MAG: tetratricopeptide repeat protein [Flavobacteriales bacterium]